uniref:Uncharacterized protein n=1 Tax=Compsopogon caeruleus TaxID=31354 RepID=A0A7S1THV5_9RHOD
MVRWRKDDPTLAFFFSILTDEDDYRRVAVEKVVSRLRRGWLGEAGEMEKRLFDLHLPTVVRMAYEAPYEDIREGFGALVEEVRSTGRALPQPSQASDYAPGIRTIDAQGKILELYQDAFLHCGRVSSVVRMMAYQPAYLEAYLTTYREILRGQGSLSSSWRCFIAIMASARLKIHYLVRVLQTEFLMSGGEEAWLVDPNAVPQKLRELCKVNAILARQPWRLRTEDLEVLVRQNSRLKWAVGEMGTALMVMTHFHSLAGFVGGCGLLVDEDMGMPWRQPGNEIFPLDDDNSASQSTDDLFRALQSGIHENEDRDLIRSSVDRQESHSGRVGTTTDISEECDRYANITGLPYPYEDFDVHSRDYKLLRAHEFSWSREGYSLVSLFSKDLARVLDDQFELIQCLTDGCIGNTAGVDTSPFREAIWKYAQRLNGIEHDDYNYARINKLLQRPLKVLVKKVVCNPETISQGDFERMGLQLRTEERVHIILLAMESRKQCALLYGLNALARLMTR